IARRSRDSNMAGLRVIGASVRSSLDNCSDTDPRADGHITKRIQTSTIAEQMLANRCAIYVCIQEGWNAEPLTEIARQIRVGPTRLGRCSYRAEVSSFGVEGKWPEARY